MNQGLVVPTSLGVPDQQQSAIQNYWNVQDSAYQQLVMMGFDELPKPNGDFPHITAQDYENIEGDQYTTTMALVDLWFVYAKDRHAWVEGRKMAKEEELKDLEREIKRTRRLQLQQAQTSKKDMPSETELKEEAQSWPACRALRREIAELDHVEGVLKARIEGLERLAAGLSRQVTVRGQNIDLGGRVGGRRPGPVR